MTAVEQRPLQEWLDDLVTTDPEARLSVAMRGVEARLAYRRVRCVEHPSVRLNWLSAHSHLARFDQPHRAGDLTPDTETTGMLT